MKALSMGTGDFGSRGLSVAPAVLPMGPESQGQPSGGHSCRLVEDRRVIRAYRKRFHGVQFQGPTCPSNDSAAWPGCARERGPVWCV